VLLAALSTGHKLGLGLVGLAFVVFALVSAFLIPAIRPDYPGRRGLPLFLTLSGAFFVAMMFAVFFFGREPSESKAEAGTTAPAETTAPANTAPTTTTTPLPSPRPSSRSSFPATTSLRAATPSTWPTTATSAMTS